MTCIRDIPDIMLKVQAANSSVIQLTVAASQHIVRMFFVAHRSIADCRIMIDIVSGDNICIIATPELRNSSNQPFSATDWNS